MTLSGEGFPKVCGDCENSYWEESYSGEDAYCGKYEKFCDSAIRECELICLRCPCG